jgi:tetratricopeptide (TPR) repeat protein
LLTELPRSRERTFRFRHALIQESIYSGLLREQRRNLHARAAYCLEEAAAARADEMAALLGHHYAMAGERGRALYYLELAGDHAAAAYANEEAVTSYRYALSLIDKWCPDPGAPNSTTAYESVDLRAKLAEVLLRTGRSPEGRDVLLDALDLLGSDDAFRAARLHALLGHREVADHNYDVAMAAFVRADAPLGEPTVDADQPSVDLWLDVQLDGHANIYYWRNDPEKGAAAIARARSLVEARGTPAQRRLFHMSFALQKMRASRYRVDDEILASLRAAVALAQETGGERDIAWALFSLGFGLLWRGELTEAQDALQASLAIVERIGDVVLRPRCICCLTVAALRRHDPGSVRSLSSRAKEADEVVSYPEYVAAAMATQAWLAWQEGRPEDVLTLAGQALQLWGTAVVSHSYYWVCLWPLIAVHLDEGRVDEAINAARQLLQPPQQRLPDELESAVQAAIAAWEPRDRKLAQDKLGYAVELAKTLCFA